MIPLNELLKNNFIDKIDLLKIDTEGFDCEILKQVNFDKIGELVFEHIWSSPEDLKREIGRLLAQGFTLRRDNENTYATRNKV